MIYHCGSKPAVGSALTLKELPVSSATGGMGRMISHGLMDEFQLIFGVDRNLMRYCAIQP
jgi:hypothetical protein